MEMSQNSPTSICSSKNFLGSLALAIYGRGERRVGEERRGGEREKEKGR
jgi:hypothetical protein